MSIVLSYLGDLSRVRIVLDALRANSTVTIERSTNQLFWQTVRGGVSLLLDANGDGQLDDYEFAADVQNFYRVRPVDPPAGLLLPGASGDYASTPDAAALDITGDIDLRADAALDDWTGIADQVLMAKWTATGSQRSYRLVIDTTGAVQLNWSTDGIAVTTRLSTVIVPVADGQRLAVRATIDVNNGASGHTVIFYTSATVDGPWIQLGVPIITAGTTSIFASTATMGVGASDAGTVERATGTIHAVRVLNGINGTEVANPNFNKQTDLAVSFVDTAGRTWTVNGNAKIVGEILETGSITPSLAGRIWLKSIRHPFLNRPVTVIDYSNIERSSRANMFDVKGRSVPVSVSDVRDSQQFTLSVTTTTLELARDMDLILAAGGTMFVHIPAGCPVPGGYTEIGDAGQTRTLPSGKSLRRMFILPCTVVAVPAADIVGTTLTWGTVLALYGSWTALLAANPTWTALLATVGSPDDLVVL